MTCPEPECDAEAEVEVLRVAPFRTTEAINSGGAVWIGEEQVEQLELVEVTCVKGHRFFGPAEMLHGRG